MVSLLDTNIIVRFLVGDDEEQLQKSVALFKKIEQARLQVEIVDGVLMEAFFVLTKFYKLPRNGVIDDLKAIIALNGVVNSDKAILFEALTILERKKIDFVDALLCAKKKLQGYEIVSFDNDLKKCLK